MSKKAIILELRPRYERLSDDRTYTRDEVIDALCAFAESVWPDEDPALLREAITEGFCGE